MVGAKRTLETGTKEHHSVDYLEQLEKSEVAEHAWQDGHTKDWSDVRILDEAPKNSVLLIKEALLICKYSQIVTVTLPN